MKIRDAKQAYTAQLDTLRDKKRTLTKLLGDQERSGSFDRVELSRELDEVNEQYKSVQGVMEGILSTEAAVRDGEAARQQAEAAARQAEELGKIMEVYRRIASGATVPAEDEKKLMDYSHELYMAAKTAAMLAQSDEDYDSLWEDEEDPGPRPDPGELAGDTEIAIPPPEAPAAEVPLAE